MQFVLIVMLGADPSCLDVSDQKANILIQDQKSWEKKVDEDSDQVTSM